MLLSVNIYGSTMYFSIFNRHFLNFHFPLFPFIFFTTSKAVFRGLFSRLFPFILADLFKTAPMRVKQKGFLTFEVDVDNYFSFTTLFLSLIGAEIHVKYFTFHPRLINLDKNCVFKLCQGAWLPFVTWWGLTDFSIWKKLPITAVLLLLPIWKGRIA